MPCALYGHFDKTSIGVGQPASRIKHDLAKVGVEGSNPFARSNKIKHLVD